MSLVECIERLREDLTWKSDMVNGHSLETIAKTYQSALPLPTKKECAAEQKIIDQEAELKKIDIQEKQDALKVHPLANITLEQASNWIDNNVGNLASIKITLKQIVKLILVKT